MCSEVSPQGVTALRLEAKGHGRVVMRLNPQFARVRWSRPQPIADGPLSHWLYRPIGSTSAPLVVLPYPGAVYAHAPSAYAPGSGSLVTQAQVLVGHGYAVLVPSLKASRGGRPDLKFAARIDTAVNAAIAAGGIDAHRIALWGHSFGGYAALIAAEASTRFDAVIAEHAPVDFVSSRGVLPFPARAYADPDRYLEFQYGWTEGGQAGFAAPPAMARAAYVEASATARADRLRAPVLLVNGDQDFVTPGQAEELAAELRRHDQSVELLTYWGEGHVLLSPANIRDFYRRSFAFLDSALLAAPRASRKLSSRAPLRRAAMSPLPPPPERPRLPAMSGPR